MHWEGKLLARFQLLGRSIQIQLLVFIFGIVIAGADTSNRPTGNRSIASFSKAKQLVKNVYQDDQVTLYCGCKYHNKKVDWQSCGYKPKSNPKRAARVEWEHVVPAHAFGQSFIEWREGHPKCLRKGKSFRGRECASKVSPEFSRIEADLYNLYPVIGEVNGLRSNYSMAEIPGEAGEFGSCELKIKDRKIYPRPEVRGDIARVYMYMDQTYPGRGIISGKNRKLFEAWSMADPPSESECRRARRIKLIQGNVNVTLEAPCASREIAGDSKASK